MIEPLFFSILCLYYLEQIELQIVCLLHIPQNRMVWRLLPCFNLTQGNSRIRCRLVQHLDKQLLGHKMRTGTGRKISPTRQKPHRTQIDFLISTHCTFHCLSGLGKCRRVENNKIKLSVPVDHFSLRKLRKQVKHVGCQILYLSIQPVCLCIFLRHLHSRLRDIHTQHIFRTALRCVQSKGTGVGKAIKHPFASA